MTKIYSGEEGTPFWASIEGDKLVVQGWADSAKDRAGVYMTPDRMRELAAALEEEADELEGVESLAPASTTHVSMTVFVNGEKVADA